MHGNASITITMLFLAGVNLSALGQDSSDDTEDEFVPTSGYEVMDIEGWEVYVLRELTDADHEKGQQAIELLELQLKQIKLLVPEDVLDKLDDVAIWLDDDPRNQIHYHPNRGWLVANGFNPDRAKAVDIGRVDQFLGCYKEQPFVVLHELAHAYHDQVLGFDHRRVRKAFENARDEGVYETVIHIRGHETRHYALTNHKEYFAECTESFLGRNDFFPFVRAELQRHDPQMDALLAEIWLGEESDEDSDED